MSLLRRLRRPPEPDVPFAVAGAGVWVGIATARLPRGVVAVAGLVFLGLWWVRSRSGDGRRLLVVIAAISIMAGLVAGSLDTAMVRRVHAAAVPDDPVDVIGIVRSDVVDERWGQGVLLEAVRMRSADGPLDAAHLQIVVRGDGLDVDPGEVVSATGLYLRRQPGWFRGRPVTAGARVDHVVVLPSHAPLHVRAGNAMRDRVVKALDDRGSQAEALTRGFLIGDIADLGRVEAEELRRAGLTHFVAVSGGNVALFLAGLWVLLIPIPMAPQTRGAVGLVALATFVVMTRWEPSVLRAAGMAALVLLGKVLGIPMDPWRALGGGVAAVLLISPRLAGAAGFHLSVAATVGLLLASHLGENGRPRWVWRGLAASTSAQLAVLPLLIGYFGSVPLLAPLANVVAAPLVSAATVLAGIGVVVGSSVVVDGGVAVARVVLEVARVAARGPQLGIAGVAVAIGVGAAVATRGLRHIGLALVVAVMALAAHHPGPGVVADSVTVLDVGQGDAIVVRGSNGAVVAIDTGPDPVVYRSALERAGVARIDLLVLTHGDGDHVGGVAGLLGRTPIGAIWIPRRDPPVPAVAALMAEAAARGVAVAVPQPGDRIDLAGVTLEVLGPLRRYDAENDESIVLLATGPVRSMLLAGDIEAVAQAELPAVHPDVLLVPHHGSATSALDWLAATVGDWAVISVGHNTYGHPSPSVLETLDAAGATVLTTRQEGDIVVPLGEGPVADDW